MPSRRTAELETVHTCECTGTSQYLALTERMECAKETFLVLYFCTASNKNKAMPENTHICFYLLSGHWHKLHLLWFK